MTRFTKVGLIALVAAAATIWLLPSASVGSGADLSRAEAELRAATQRLGSAVQETVAPVADGLKSTRDRTKSALSKAKRDAAKAGTAAKTRATATDPPRQPPLHGAGPHGQGGVAVVDLNPSAERPLGANPNGSDSNEEVVVGRARGEQGADGRYHGHITILGLFGNELGGVDTAEGETKNGPLQPLQEGVLDPLCTASGNQICLSVLTANSATTPTGSTNDFAVARAGVLGLGVGAAESGGTISQTPDCQTSAGGARTANVTASGAVAAAAANSAATSTSCRGQAPQISRTSQVIQLGAAGLPLPAAGCANDTPDTTVEIPLVATIVCNADEVAGAAVVREALDVFVLNTGTNSLVKETTAASEAVSVAPAGPETAGPQCSDGVDNDGDGVIDAADPGCHTDGNPNNPASYDPTDNSEADARTGGAGGETAGRPECSDNRDNDGDGRIDERDPGCHTDGNANNPASYDPDDDDERDEGGAAGAGAGGGAGGGGAGAADSTLPFTGSNAIGLLLAGLLVLAGGLVLRRREDGLTQA